jgi:hypothetical protein
VNGGRVTARRARGGSAGRRETTSTGEQGYRRSSPTQSQTDDQRQRGETLTDVSPRYRIEANAQLSHARAAPPKIGRTRVLLLPEAVA